MTSAKTSGLSSQRIHRSRLVDFVISCEGSVLILGGFKSGKTELAQQLIARGFSPELVRDDVVHWNKKALSELAQLSGRAVVLCSGVPDHSPLDAIGFSDVLRNEDLFFDIDEIEELLVAFGCQGVTTSALASVLAKTTSGWPAAVAAIAEVLALQPETRREAERVALRGPHLTPILEGALAGLERSQRRNLQSLANLRFILPEFNAVEGGIDVADLMAKGVPLLQNPDRSFFLPEVLRVHLTESTDLSAEHADLVAPILVERLGITTALDALAEAEAYNTAVEVFARSTDKLVGEADGVRLAQVVRSLVSKAEPNASALLAFAGLLQTLAKFAEFTAVANRCVELARTTDEAEVELRARLLLACHRAQMHDGRIEEAEMRKLEELQAKNGDEITLLNLQEVEVHQLTCSSSVHDQATSIRLGHSLAERLQSAGMNSQAVRLLRRIGAGPALHLGRLTQVNALFSKASDYAGEDAQSIQNLVVGAIVAALSGDERTLAHTQELATSFDEFGEFEWLGAYIWFAKMVAESHQGARKGVRYGYQRYRELIGELRDGPTGLFCEAYAASSFALVGETGSATRIIDELGDRRHQNLLEFMMAELIVEARTGEYDTAVRLGDELMESDVLPAEREWRVDLELLVARHNAGHPVADDDLGLVMKEAAIHGMQKLAHLLSSDLRTEEPGDDRAVRLELFGEFALTVGGIVQNVPPGRPANLVKFLALRDAPISVDGIIDVFWPDTSLERGRKRLKNVVSRSRQLIGADNIVRTQESLSIHPSVVTDIAEFRHHVGAANTAPDHSNEFEEGAVAALNIASQGLLPEDRFEDWTAEDRWHIEAVSTNLTERLIESLPLGRVNADWLVETAGCLGFKDDTLFYKMAIKCAELDATAAARMSLGHAKRIAEDLGVPFSLPPELDGFRGLKF